MRTIKFDAIYKPTGQHVEVVELNFNDNTITYRDEKGDCDWCHFSLDGKYGDVILRQFTGLHDKNGKEIYEGDVLKARVDDRNILTCEVVFESPSFSRKWLNENTANLRGQKVEALAWNTHILYEVIGNVYENPELLEQTS